MNLNIEISDKDCESIMSTVMTVGEMSDTLKGRIYTSIVRAHMHGKSKETVTLEDEGKILHILERYLTKKSEDEKTIKIESVLNLIKKLRGEK